MGRFRLVSRPFEKVRQKQEGCLSGVTFDAGALIALDRSDRRILALIACGIERGFRLTVPATAFAQAVRNPARQARLMRLARQPFTDLAPLDAPDATAAGMLLAQTGTSDIVDAHVAICARRAGGAIVTSHPKDLSRLAPELQLIAI